MSRTESPFETIRAKSADLIRHKLFHPRKDNREIVALAEEFADLWPAWIKSGSLEAEVNAWLRKLDLSHTGFWHGPGSGIPPVLRHRRRFEAHRGWTTSLLGRSSGRNRIKPGDVLLGSHGFVSEANIV